jgi:hypothetical protein
VDYSFFIMVMKVESLERVEITPTTPCWSFPPPIFVSHALVSWFCVSAALSFVTCRGTLYIVSFRSDESIGTKIDGIRTTRGE